MNPTHQKVINTICTELQITQSEMFCKSRKRLRVLARYLYMKWLRLNTRYTLSDIGGEFRNWYDHTTVIHGITTADNMIHTDTEIRLIWQKIDAITEPPPETFTELNRLMQHQWCAAKSQIRH